MALNCGARSCPPIRVFSAANLEAELEGARAEHGWVSVPAAADAPHLRRACCLGRRSAELASPHPPFAQRLPRPSARARCRSAPRRAP